MTIMPVQATCCRCKREFPVKAVMSLPGGNIPLLVVLSEVSRVEEAIALATCQVCLNKEGPIDRGLHAILASLGCKQPKAEGLHMNQQLIPGNRTSARLSMSGVRVVLPKMPDKPSLPLRRPAPPREPSLDERPRLPKVLEEPSVCEPEPKVDPLRVSLDDRSIAALKAAGVVARKRGEKKHPVIVVRTKSVFPTPNKPLGEPEDPCPKIIYPDGGLYGVTFTVHGSRRIPPKDRSWSWAQMTLAVWSLDHENTMVICNGVLVNLCSLMCFYLEPFVLPQSEESAQVVQVESTDTADTEIQPHAEV